MTAAVRPSAYRHQPASASGGRAERDGGRDDAQAIRVRNQGARQGRRR